MKCSYKTFSLNYNIKYTYFTNYENKDHIPKETRDISLNIYKKNESLIIKCEENEIMELLENYTGLESYTVNEIVKSINENIPNYSEDSNKVIQLNNLINNRFIKNIYNIRLAIERVFINNILCSENGNINKNNQNYYIYSYSILYSEKLLISDFIILEDISFDSLERVSKLILEEISWIETEKKEFEYEKSFDIILKNTSSGMFFHECIGHFLEADHYQLSPIKNLINTRFCSPNITITENFECKRLFDSAGYSISKDLLLIENGYIKNVLSNNMFNYLSGISNTGNNIFEKTSYFNLPRMRSMILHPKPNKLGKVISDTNNGILIEKISMGEVNVYSGHFSVLVAKSHLIKNSTIQNPLEEFSINLNIRDFMKMNVMVCDDLLTQYSLCGKSGSVVRVEYSSPSVKITF